VSIFYCYVQKIREKTMKKLIIAALSLVLIATSFYRCERLRKFDYIIKNGKIVNGTGNPWYKADIGIMGNKIAEIGLIPEKKGNHIIDAAGKVVSPGFIDIHTHTDGVEEDPTAHNYIMQGVTTVISGNCGGSNLGLKEFFKTLEKQGIALNFATFVGHGSIRDTVMGNEAREPTAEELEKMKKYVEEGMKAGALGLSTGLEYTPGIYSKTDEIIELAKVASKYGGVYATHMRNEGAEIVESIEEAIEISKKASIPVEVSHFKVFGAENWGNSKTTIKLINDARKKGIDITVDQYPYPAASTGLVILFPPWSLEGKEWKERLKNPEHRKKVKKELIYNIVHRYAGNDFNRIQIANYPEDTSMEGKGLTDILEMKGREVTPDNATELVLELVLNKNDVVYHGMSEEDVERIMKNPATMHASDGHITEMDVGVPHPRNYGTFPRVLSEYVRERGILTLEESIRKMTSMVASRIGLKDTGIISVGKHADIVIFNSITIKDKATFENPHQYPEGIDYVFVNGEIVVAHGKITGKLPGRIIYGPRKELLSLKRK